MRFRILADGEIEAENIDDCLRELSDRIWDVYEDVHGEEIDSGATILDLGEFTIEPVKEE